jgi:hypothetical protein
MNAAIVTRITGFLTAVVMTVAINGGMLLMFDDVAQADQAGTTVVALDTVTIVGKRI